MAHTAGPWTTDTDKRFRAMTTEQLPEAIGVRGPDEMFLGAAFDFNRTDRDAEVEANARLIAAAPDLLWALESLLEEFGARLSDGKPIGYTVGSMNHALTLVKTASAAIDKAYG